MINNIGIFRWKYLPVLVAFVVSACGRVQVLDTTITEWHVCLEGTRICLIPPKGFTPAATHCGFESKDVAGNLVVSHHRESYLDGQKEFDEGFLRENNARFLSDEPIQIAGFEGRLMCIAQLQSWGELRKDLLVFGDSNEVTFVQIIYPSIMESEVAPHSMSCLQSIVYDSSRTNDPVMRLPFGISREGTKLKPLTWEMTSVTFTMAGMALEKAWDGVVVEVGASEGYVLIPDKREHALAFFEEHNSVYSIVLDSIMPVVIDGMEGYEMVGHGMALKTDEPALVHKVILYSDQGHFYVSSRATNRFEFNLDLFKRLSATFQRRKGD